MGLGGIARDSIADLASLVDSSSDGNVDHDIRRRFSAGREHRPSSFTSDDKGGKLNIGGAGVDADEYLRLDEEEALEEEQKCALNDDGDIHCGPIDLNSNNTQTIAQAAPSATATPAQSELYYGFQYEGYQDYYAEDFSPYYSHDTKQEPKNIFCCFFSPWMKVVGGVNEEKIEQGGQQEPKQMDKEQQQSQQTAVQTQCAVPSEGSESSAVTSAADTGSEQLGQELRLQTESPSHAAGPVIACAADDSNTATVKRPIVTNMAKPLMDQKNIAINSNKNSEAKARREDPSKDLNSGKSENQAPGPKSILKVKRCSIHHKKKNTTSPQAIKNKSEISSDGKRHLFPSYGAKNTSPTKKSEEEDRRSIEFNPMARVLTIPSRKDIPLSQKAQVWWQRSDYDDFKKTGRIISKAMECGGSEIWLTSTNAWGKGQQAAKETKKEADENERLVGKESDLDSEYVKALEKYIKRSTANGHNSSASENTGDNFGNKWWCKFGHSRRGLEHIVSSSEGKARQQSVLLAIQMILEEQKRQRVTRTRDPNKLRNVALQYTSWARDLALAAGAADNEAVETNFDVSAKSRSHHFAEKSKHLLLKDNNIAGGGVAMAITSQILDENTHGRRSTVNVTNLSRNAHDSHLEHVDSETSLSKKARGFIPGGDSSDVPASQIMSGLGNLPSRVKA